MGPPNAAPAVAPHATRTPPGPRGLPVLGSALDFRKNVIDTFMEGWRAHGDVVRFRIAHLTTYLLVHPDHVKQVIQDKHRMYPHSRLVDDKLAAGFGDSLLTTDGDEWLHQRRLTQPAFHRQRIAGFTTIMTETVRERLDQWQSRVEDGDPLELRSEMQQLTLTVLAKALFSTNLADEAKKVGDAATVGVDYLNRQLVSPVNLPESIPLPLTRRFLKARATLSELVYRLIAERRASGEEKEDLLSMLLAARDEETGETLSDREVHDEVLTILLAGHETVANALTWNSYILSQHPAIADRLRSEVDEVLDGRVPTSDDMPHMPYTGMVINETLRLYPTIWVVARTPKEDDEVGGYRIRAGTTVYLSPYVTHRHPDFWDDPEAVDPERFTPDRSEGRHRYAYFPFSGGPRKCIGDYFALTEMHMTIPMIAQRFRLHLVPGHPVALRPEVSLRPRNGMPMTLERRTDGPRVQT